MRRTLTPVLALVLLLVAGALSSSYAVQRGLPERVVVEDGRSSHPSVDISEVELRASPYFDSEQVVLVSVPNGFRPGHHLRVWFDVDGDDEPEGHHDVWLSKPARKGGQFLRKEQDFRRGGGWDGAGELVRCTGSDGYQPLAVDVERGRDYVALALDLWWCLKAAQPPGAGPKAAWRVAVQLTRGTRSDSVPAPRRWSPPVLGWSPCGEDC